MSNSNTLGPLVVGIILAALSHGVLALQTNRYFHKPNKDPLFMKLLILFIWLAAIAHLFLVASGFYVLTVTNHAKPIPEASFPLTLPAALGLGAFVRSSVQSIYTYRLYRLTSRWEFPTSCWALSMYVLGSGIAYAVIEAQRLTAALLFPTSSNWLVYSHLSVGAAADILITVSTCWSLVQRRDLGLKDTQRMVNRIMLRIVQTGVTTSMLAVCILVTFVTCQPSSIWLGLYMTLTPLYPMTLLALFNGRARTNESSTIQTIGISVESHIHFGDGAGPKSSALG